MTDFTFATRLPETITTPRLTLVCPTRVHVTAMARLANNVKIHNMLARLPHPYAVSDAEHFIDAMARTKTEQAYAICTRDQDFIGTFSFMHNLDKVEIGYWLGEPYWGEGFGSEVVAAMTDAANDADAPALHAYAKTDNVSSRRILEKSGYKQTHEKINDCGQHKDVSITYYRRERDNDR